MPWDADIKDNRKTGKSNDNNKNWTEFFNPLKQKFASSINRKKIYFTTSSYAGYGLIKLS